MDKCVWVGGKADGVLVVLTKGVPGYLWPNASEPVPEMKVWMMSDAAAVAAVMAKGAN
jgi:hypothetical protein